MQVQTNRWKKNLPKKNISWETKIFHQPVLSIKNNSKPSHRHNSAEMWFNKRLDIKLLILIYFKRYSCWSIILCKYYQTDLFNMCRAHHIFTGKIQCCWNNNTFIHALISELCLHQWLLHKKHMLDFQLKGLSDIHDEEGTVCRKQFLVIILWSWSKRFQAL